MGAFIVLLSRVPKRHIRKSDITKSHCKMDGKCCQTDSPAHEFCYSHQCYETTKQVAQYLELKEGTYSTSFNPVWDLILVTALY